MADKIKILEIKRDGDQIPSDSEGKKNFTPVDDLWFMDETKTDTSAFKTEELGQTIDNVKIKNDQISIIKNANANFFVTPTDKASVKTVVSNLPKSINVIENANDGESALPKNILELRKVEYAHEQDLKDKLLEKLSIKLEKEVDSSVAKRRKSRSSKKDLANINIEDTTTEDFDITDTNNFDIPSEKPKLKTKSENSMEDLVSPKSVESANQSPTSQSQFNNSSYSATNVSQQNIGPVTENNPTSDNTGFFDVDVHDITAVLQQTSNQNIKTMSEKNFARNLNIPVINNEDFTITNTVNDFNKQVNSVSTNQVHMMNSLDDTTILVNNLLSEMNKVNQKNPDIKNADFDSFEDWFKASKESKRLQKLAKKENKKMLKKKV